MWNAWKLLELALVSVQVSDPCKRIAVMHDLYVFSPWWPSASCDWARYCLDISCFLQLSQCAALHPPPSPRTATVDCRDTWIALIDDTSNRYWPIRFLRWAAPRFWIFVLGQEGCMPTVPAISSNLFKTGKTCSLDSTMSKSSLRALEEVHSLAGPHSGDERRRQLVPFCYSRSGVTVNLTQQIEYLQWSAYTLHGLPQRVTIYLVANLLRDVTLTGSRAAHRLTLTGSKNNLIYLVANL